MAGPRPWWASLLATHGLATLLILYLFGLVPGVPSPLMRFFREHEALANALTEHTQATADLLRTNRLICRGVWQAAPVIQRECDR